MDKGIGIKRVLSGLLSIVLLVSSVVIPLLPAQPVMATTSTFYPDAHVETSSVDGYVYYVNGFNNTWATVRNSTGTNVVDDSDHAAVAVIEGTEINYFHSIARGITIFDTSSLPDLCIINSATLSLYGEDKNDPNNWQPNINVYSVATAGSTSLSTADYLYTNFGSTAFSTAITYSGWSTSGYNNFVLNASGLAHISKTGVTKFGIRNANCDVANNAPTANGDFEESSLFWYTAEKGVGYKPKLVVNYTVISEPEITANDASNIAQTTARLNSTLDSDGNDTCEVRFGYGTTTQTADNFLLYDTVTDWVDDYTSGEHPYIDVDTLIADTTYFYRVQARNDAGTVTSDEITFDTEASLNEPSNFRAIPTATTVALAWTKGTGSSTTLIRYSFEAYPDDIDVGVELYSGSGSSTTHSGIASGTTIYYSAWGESGGSYSGDGDDYATLLVTTLAGSDVDVDITSPVEPANWFLDVDYTTQSNMPFYSTINDIADSVSVPRTTAWMMSGILVSMLGGFIVYSWRKDLLASSIVMAILLGLASAQMLVPGWILFLVIVVVVAIALTRRHFAG